MEAIQPYPDFAGGSGVSLLEYWLDDFEREKILIIYEQGEIYYETFNEDATLNSSEKLFDAGEQR